MKWLLNKISFEFTENEIWDCLGNFDFNKTNIETYENNKNNTMVENVIAKNIMCKGQYKVYNASYNLKCGDVKNVGSGDNVEISNYKKYNSEYNFDITNYKNDMCTYN